MLFSSIQTVDLNICRPLRSSITPLKEKERREETDNLEDLIIIWLDENSNEPQETVCKRRTRLRDIVNSLRAFNDSSQCLTFIQSIKEEKIFLIISGSLGKIFIDQVHHLAQVSSVYIYCFDPDQHKQWTINYEKIVGTFTNENSLIPQLTRDVSVFFRNSLPVSVIHSIDTSERSTQDLNKDQARFMWSQVLMEALLQLPQTRHSKDQFLQECRRHYRNNRVQQKNIADFEKTYHPSQAIRWYTRNTFLYRVVNKALRTQNILRILKCRFFVVDLYRQLERLHAKSIQTLPNKCITVYRGQTIAADEFHKLKMNINGFIAINTFLSTTTASMVAMDFAGDGSSRPVFESVLFEIEIDLKIHKAPFADVHRSSQFIGENEFILPLGTVFRIETIEPITEKLWFVKLKSANETDATKLQSLTDYFTIGMKPSSSHLWFGKILQGLGEYDQAQQYYELLLGELSPTDRSIAAVYTGLGSTIAKTQRHLRRALNYLRHSLKLQMKIFPENFLLFAETLLIIAGIFVEYRRYQFALDYYELILAMLDCLQPNDHSRVSMMRAEIYNNIGYIYSKLSKLSSALKYYRMSHEIDKRRLPSNHPAIATSLNNMAMIYLRKNNFRLADKYLQHANQIRLESLPFDHHPDLVQMYNNLGVAQYERKRFDQALILLNKALEIQLQCLPPVHPHTATLYNSLGNACRGKKDYEKALTMYERALDIGEQCWKSNHPTLSQAYGNIGDACRYLKDYTRALRSCEKAIDVAKKCLPITDPDLAEAYSNLAEVYIVILMITPWP